MRTIAVAALVTLLAAQEAAGVTPPLRLAAESLTAFGRFKQRFGRRYASRAEEARRLAIFTANQRRAVDLAASNPIATFDAEHSPFGDVLADEFRRTHHNAETHFRELADRRHTIPVASVPASAIRRAGSRSVDWRAKGAVTPVKNQAQCGSCWSFSTTGNIEGQWFLAGNKLTSLSEQQLVSCELRDLGCGGGLQTDAFDWFLRRRNGKVFTEASWPYVSGNGTVPSCTKNDFESREVGAVITGFHTLPSDEDVMAVWVLQNGPLSIGVDASAWSLYKGGIMTNCGSRAIDHAVLIIGFDDAHSPPYWIIKNSWGPSWGEEGYIRVEMGTNQCLLKEQASSSVVSPKAAVNPPPKPAADARVFRQYVCSDPTCSYRCHEAEYTDGSCVNTGPSASLRGSCPSTGVHVSTKQYATPDCSGPVVSTATEPVNQCAASFNGRGTQFVRNLCPHALPPIKTTYTMDVVIYETHKCQGRVTLDQTFRDVAKLGCLFGQKDSSILNCTNGGKTVTVMSYKGIHCKGPGVRREYKSGQCAGPAEDIGAVSLAYVCSKEW